MTEWLVRHHDILAVPADGLICSANPYLNLSGGVGGALLLKYGDELQKRLHQHLQHSSQRYVSTGHVVVTPPCGSPYKAIAHGVAIDAFYDTNPDIIRTTYQKAIAQLLQSKCRSIAAACLGCGYGRCPIPAFLEAIEPLLGESNDQLERLTFVTTNHELSAEIQTLLDRCS